MDERKVRALRSERPLRTFQLYQPLTVEHGANDVLSEPQFLSCKMRVTTRLMIHGCKEQVRKGQVFSIDTSTY